MPKSEFLGPPSAVWEMFPPLESARTWSMQRVDAIRGRLSDIDQQASGIRSVVLSGSLARLDASAESDCDLIIEVDDVTLSDDSRAERAVAAVWERLQPLGLIRPQAAGVFVRPTSRGLLCDGARGIVDESVVIFGQRIQLLLEARPVFGEAACQQLQRDILLRYCQHPFGMRHSEYWSYLIDDLIRYWRSYRVWRQWDGSPGNGGWYLRNLKLRYSRLITYAGMLVLCLVDELTDPDVDSLLPQLRLTPLERIWCADQMAKGEAFPAIGQAYARFVNAITDPVDRAELEHALPSSPQQAMGEGPARFAPLLDGADQIVGALWDLVQALPDTPARRITLAKLLF